MKTRHLLSAALLFPVLATSPLAANLVMVGGGVSSTYTSGAPFVEASNRMGYHVGVGFEAELAPRFAYAIELNLETRGEHGTFNPGSGADGTGGQGGFGAGSGDIDSELKLLYLHAPLFMVFKVPMGTAGLDLFGGPTFGIPLSGEVVYTGGSNPPSRDITDDLTRPDLGLETGFGVRFPLGRALFFIRPSYYLGLTDMNKESFSEGAMRSIKLKLGVGIPLGMRANPAE